MATSRFNIGSKFQNGDIPSQSDFVEIFDSFVHKDEDKADFQMVETGTNNDHYVTPALLRTGLQNIGIITGNCYMPHKEYFESSFSGTTISLEKLPIRYSVKIYKNGQLLQEGQEGEEKDYTINYDTAVVTFSGVVSERNLEIDYWFKNLNPVPGGNSSTAVDFTSFLHTSGNETKNGLLTFNNITPTSTSGIVLTNSGAGTNATALNVSVSDSGNGISLQNSSTGTGFKLSNTGVGVGLNLNSANGSNGNILQVSKNNVLKTKIDNEGNVTAPKFITVNGTASHFVKGDGTLDSTVYPNYNDVIHTTGNESKDGALTLTHNTSVQDVLTINKNNSANCLKLVQNSNSSATTSTFDTTTTNLNRKAISVRKIDQENAFITHEGNVTATSFTTFTLKADITDGLLTLANSATPAALQSHAKLYAKTDGTTDMYVMGSDGVEKKIGIPSDVNFDNFLRKDEDKADLQMIETGTDNERYVTPALLRAGLQNIIAGNCYIPHKEYFDSSFSGTTLSLEKLPVRYSVKIYKNGQLLQEGEEGDDKDYTVNYDTAVVTFSDMISDRNLEIDYWSKNLSLFPSDSSTSNDFNGVLTLANSPSPTALQGHAKLYAKTDGTTDIYVMGSDGVEKKIGGSTADLSNFTSGSFTPTLSQNLNNVNGITLKTANYTKIGNIVTVQYAVNLSILASSTNSFFEIEAPVIRTGSTSGYYVGQGTVYATGLPQGIPGQAYFLSNNQSYIRFLFTSETGYGPRDVTFSCQYDVKK